MTFLYCTCDPLIRVKVILEVNEVDLMIHTGRNGLWDSLRLKFH